MKTKLFLGWATAFVLLVGVGGCEVTSEKIQRWKRSTKGPAKLRAAVRDTDQKMELRVEAAEALAELQLCEHLNKDIRSLQTSDRSKLMQALVKGLVSKMEGSNPSSSNRVQIHSKDALFSLREAAETELKRFIDEKVVRWLLGDWRLRASGEHSSEKIISTIGASAGPLLVEALSSSTTPPMAIATLLRKVGDQQAKDQAAVKLIAIAEKENPVKAQTFQALGTVGSVKATEYLAGVARGKGPLQQRVWALVAIGLYPHPSVIPLVRAIAADTRLVGEYAELRDEAFTALEKIEDPRSLEALAGFLQSGEEKVRYRAVEALLEGFEIKGLTKLLETLPSGYTYKKEDLEDLIEKFILDLGPKTLPVLRASLKSKKWIVRLIAARVLGHIGKKEDIAPLENMAEDNTRLKGWPGLATIGSEAVAAAKAIRGRAK